MTENRGAVRLSIGRADRVALFGKTGAGKTTTARHLLSVAHARTRTPFVVIDPKRTFRMDGVPVVRDFRSKEERQIIRDDGFGDLDFWDEQLFRIWEAGSRIVYVDEATLITPPRSILPSLGALIRTGRERDLGTWTGSQRPKDLPSPIFTEAEHFFVFRLSWEHDREKVVSFTSPYMREHLDAIKTRARKHDCVYYDVGNDRLVYLHMTQEPEQENRRARRRTRSPRR